MFPTPPIAAINHYKMKALKGKGKAHLQSATIAYAASYTYAASAQAAAEASIHRLGAYSRFGIVVMVFITSTKLSYVVPG